MLGDRTLSAPAILRAILEGFGPIWRANPGQGDEWATRIHGDVWRHRHAGGNGPMAGFVPFHKLSQWLAYSLFEPFEWAGYTVIDRDALTALPEYRNGGLLIDTGVLQLINDADRATVWDVGSEIIVEWRALTVSLSTISRSRCARSSRFRSLPLACVLEGGTWAAGREFANRAATRRSAAQGPLRRHGFLTGSVRDTRFASFGEAPEPLRIGLRVAQIVSSSGDPARRLVRQVCGLAAAPPAFDDSATGALLRKGSRHLALVQNRRVPGQSRRRH